MDTENRKVLLLQTDGGPQIVDMLVTIAGPRRTMTPHPQLLMDHVENGEVNQICNAIVIDSLKGMNRKFVTPFVIFTPRQAKGKGHHLPYNQTIMNIIDGTSSVSGWRGDAVVVKYDSAPFGVIVDCSSSDFPLIRNWLINRAKE